MQSSDYEVLVQGGQRPEANLGHVTPSHVNPAGAFGAARPIQMAANGHDTETTQCFGFRSCHFRCTQSVPQRAGEQTFHGPPTCTPS